MSEVAYNEFGEEWTAFQLQDKFLEHGMQFLSFTCKYCDTELSPVAIYGEGFEKAPHFRLKDSFKPHHPTECPYGADTKVGKLISRKPKKKYQFNVVLPECLVALRPSQLAPRVASELPNKTPSEDEIRRRVQTAANLGVISNHYTTGLLKTLVDARKAAINAIKILPSIKNIEPDKEKWQQIFVELGKAPLSLYGRKLNYKTAFRPANYLPWNGLFIYYGNAKVEATAYGFLLTLVDNTSSKKKEVKDNKDNEKTADIPAQVKYFCQKGGTANQMEKHTIDSLTQAESSKESIIWHAYGEFKLNSSGMAYELIVRQYAHLYV